MKIITVLSVLDACAFEQIRQVCLDVVEEKLIDEAIDININLDKILNKSIIILKICIFV